MVGYDFGMHQTGVLLDFLMLACRTGARSADRRRVLVMGVLCDGYLSARQHNCARDYG